MNNNERSQWIDNDEELYRWWLAEKKSKAAFIKRYREEIDEIIDLRNAGYLTIDD